MSWCNGYEGEKCFLCDEPTMYNDMDMFRNEWVCTECQQFNEENLISTDVMVIKERMRRDAKAYRMRMDEMTAKIKAGIQTRILIDLVNYRKNLTGESQ